MNSEPTIPGRKLLVLDANILVREDQDFFGSGVATWTTDRVEIYLRTEQ